MPKLGSTTKLGGVRLTSVPLPDPDTQAYLDVTGNGMTYQDGDIDGIGTDPGDATEAPAAPAAPKGRKTAAKKTEKPWQDRVLTQGGSIEGELIDGAEVDFGFAALTDEDDYLNVLMYGPEGTGKTTNAAKMANLPGIGRILVISAEGGLKKQALIKRGVLVDRIVTWPPRGQAVTFELLAALHRKVLADLMDDPGAWGGVVMDSGTEVHQALLEQAQERRFGKLEAAGVKPDLDELDGADFGVMGNELRKLMRRFRDLPSHFVITALERVDKKTGMVGPQFSPSIGGDIRGYVDMVIACRASQYTPGEDEEQDRSLAEFRALTRQGKLTRAKDRFDVTPRVIAEPSFDRLMGYLKGELSEETDPIQAAYVARAKELAELEAAEAVEKEAKKAAVLAAAKGKTAKQA